MKARYHLECSPRSDVYREKKSFFNLIVRVMNLKTKRSLACGRHVKKRHDNVYCAVRVRHVLRSKVYTNGDVIEGKFYIFLFVFPTSNLTGTNVFQTWSVIMIRLPSSRSNQYEYVSVYSIRWVRGAAVYLKFTTVNFDRSFGNIDSLVFYPNIVSPRPDRENRTANLADPSLAKNGLRRLRHNALRTMFYSVYQGSPTVLFRGKER